MCDIAILVVDIMHGLEPQTIESLSMLSSRKSPFIVALNKIDCMIDWVKDNNAPFLTTFSKQLKHTKEHFNRRLNECKLQFSEQGYNTELYFNNKNMKTDISLVPTSAITGEGIPDLLYLIVQLTKRYMESRITFSELNFSSNVLEVKQTVGYGATIDVILSNGTLYGNDTIVVCGMNGPIVTKIRALLLPCEAQEMRVKNSEFKIVQSVSASAGIRIASHESLEHAIAGSQLFVLPRNIKNKDKKKEILEILKDEAQRAYAKLFSKINKQSRGVWVQASTLGALEALITFLTSDKVSIPICGIGIGDIHKQCVIKASIMLEHQPEYAVILAFNVKITNDALIQSKQMGVRIFNDEIIYRLQKKFEDYINELREKRKLKASNIAVFPVEFKILGPEHVFRNKNPLLLGVQILRGTLRKNTPICVKKYDSNGIGIPLSIGKIDGIQLEKKEVEIAKINEKVSIRIKAMDEEQSKIQCGRNFEINELLISEISRDSLDALKDNFEIEMKKEKDTIQHIGELKQYFGII